MSPDEVVEAVGRAGVLLYLEGGRLRFRGPAGAYDARLRALVAEHRAGVVARLQERQRRADEALAEILALVGRGGALGRAHPGRRVVVEVWEGLARRWHAAGDTKLFEVAAGLAVVLERWAAEDGLRFRATRRRLG